jgi:hypothetical protein
MITRKLLPVLMIACFFHSCSGGSSPIPFDAYCDRYVEFACSTALRCNCLSGYSEELCRSYLMPECENDIEEPVRSGKMAYDEVEAGNCLAGLKSVAADCSTDGDHEPDACDRFLIGQLTVGQDCEDDEECTPGLDCYESVCRDLPKDGQACLEFGTCASNHFCGTDNLCHTYRARGESCADQAVCDDDLYCDNRTYTCESYLGANQSCAHASWSCGDDLYCSDLSTTCRPYPGQGGDCADSHGTCADDHYCSSDDTCQKQKPDGQPCSEDRECMSNDCEGGNCMPEENSICDQY